MAVSTQSIAQLRSLPLSDVHAHVFGKGEDAPLAIINLARREKLEKVYLLCRGYREQLPVVRANRDIARMMMYPDVGSPGWWTKEEPFLLENRDNVYGVKLNPSRSPVRPSLESHSELFASAEKHGFVIVTHTDTGESANAANFEPLLEKYPGTKLVLYHAAPLETSIRLMKRFANVYVDVSFTAFNAQVQQRVVQEVGPERIVFGIDTPLGWPKDDAGNAREHYRDVIEEIAPWYGYDEAVLRKVLHENSARLFGA